MECSICEKESQTEICSKCSNSDQRQYYYTNRKERLIQGLCARCGQKPPLELSNHCQECKDYAWKYAQSRMKAGFCYKCGKNPKISEFQAMCQKCKDEESVRDKQKKEARRKAGVCSNCGRELEAGKSYKTCLKCREKCRNQLKKLRSQVINHYGAKCQCCGESRYEFLTVDHINGGGTKHRQSVGDSSKAVYKSIIRSGFPSSIQILCFNCNCGRQVNGGICPHQQEKATQDPHQEVPSSLSFDEGQKTISPDSQLMLFEGYIVP